MTTDCSRHSGLQLLTKKAGLAQSLPSAMGEAERGHFTEHAGLGWWEGRVVALISHHQQAEQM